MNGVRVQEEEVGGVWLVGGVEEVRDGWCQSLLTNAEELTQSEPDRFGKLDTARDD